MVDPVYFIIRFFFDFWWILFPYLLFKIFWEKFVSYRKSIFRKKNIKWSFMEIRFPEDISQNLKSMEEVFNSLHAIHPDPTFDLNWISLNIKGFIPKSYILIMIAHNKNLKFFIRYPSELKSFIQSRFYAQYPAVQFIDCDDPLSILPVNVPNSLFSCQIFDVRLNKEDSYPIKTYRDLDDLKEEEKIDFLTSFSESAWELSEKEWLIFQFFILPTTGDNNEYGKKWIERGQKLINKLIGKKEESIVPKSSLQEILDSVGEFTLNLIRATFFLEPEWTISKSEDKSSESKNYDLQKLTPGERKILEAIQRKLSKLGYWCNFRVSYVATKDVADQKKNTIPTLISGIFKNFSTEDLNGFSIYPLIPNADGFSFRSFFIIRKEYNNLKSYRLPSLPGKFKNKLKPKNLDVAFVLNTEELATIFHPPIRFVQYSSIERIPYKEFPPVSDVPLIQDN